MRILQAAVVCALLACVASCSDKAPPSAPSSSTPPPPSAESIVRGRTVNASDGTAEGGVSVQIGSGEAVVTDSAGLFQATVSGPGLYTAVVRGSTIVERQTKVGAPEGDARLSLIPSSFDLDAFDQLARTANARLQRWTTRPSLVVIASVLVHASVDDGYVANADKIPELEISGLITHLTEGLSLWTGGTLTSFGSTAVERPAAGDTVSVKRRGKIVVGRYTGIAASDGAIGYGTWLEDSDGSVTGGAIFLDEAFDHSDKRRRLLRIHELGHAMGYLHVTNRDSIMNPKVGPEPTDFDRTAASIVFQRPPGNRPPDRDPEPFGITAQPPSGPRWAPPIP